MLRFCHVVRQINNLLKKNPYAIVDVVNGDFDRARQSSFDAMCSRQNVGGGNEGSSAKESIPCI